MEVSNEAALQMPPSTLDVILARRVRLCGIAADLIALIGLACFVLDAVGLVKYAAGSKHWTNTEGLWFYPFLILFGIVSEAIAIWRFSRCFQQYIRHVILLIALAGMCCISSDDFASHREILQDYGTHLRIQSFCGEDHLQQWASNLLEKPQSAWPVLLQPENSYDKSTVPLDPKKLPEYVNSLTIGDIDVRRRETSAPVNVITGDGNQAHVKIRIGYSNLSEWGVIVGAPGLTMKSHKDKVTESEMTVYKWRNGMYGYRYHYDAHNFHD